MANRDGRRVLWGVEEETFDLLSEALASEQWAELLKAPLELAARKGKRGLARKLVRAGAEMGDALHEAALGGHEGIANDLLEGGASVAARDAGSRTPLHVAAEGGESRMVQLLILKGADKDALDGSDSSPLYLAVYHNRVASAQALMVAGADVNFLCTSQGTSVVQMAAEKGHVETLRAVIAHGADLDVFEIHRSTALHLAAGNNQVEAIDVLVDAGADIEAGGEAGAAPLHDAASYLSIEAVTVLLKHGANPNAQTIHGKTPLHRAAEMAGMGGDAEVVDALLRLGADETILDDEGRAAVDVVDSEVGEDNSLAEDAERVRELLVNAPADRAWRRRGYLVLCHAHPDRIQLIQESSSRAPAGMAQRTRSHAKLARPETNGCTGAGGSAAGERTSGDGVDLLAMVLGLQEDDIFRTIVGYL